MTERKRGLHCGAKRKARVDQSLAPVGEDFERSEKVLGPPEYAGVLVLAQNRKVRESRCGLRNANDKETKRNHLYVSVFHIITSSAIFESNFGEHNASPV